MDKLQENVMQHQGKTRNKKQKEQGLSHQKISHSNTGK